MIPLRVVIVVFVLLIQCTEESESRSVLVNKKEFVNSPENGVLNENVPQDEAPCCTTGACTCHSLLHALANLTDNVLINITTDVVLSSIVQVVGVKNIVINGYRNPTVYCNNTGGVKFITSGYITIDGIIWNGCGFSNITNMLHSHPGLGMENSFNITVKNCTFINSTGQAIEILNVMDNVMVTNCVFINNILYAVNYIMNDSAIHYLLSLTIDNCTFRENGRVNSVVNIKGHSSNIMPISICNSIFVDNQGIPIYITYQNVHLCGFIAFKRNKCAAILSLRNSYITFNRNSNVTFHSNRIHHGAIYSIDNSTILFEEKSTVTFTANSASFGGAVYSSDNSKISFIGNSAVTFTKNTATYGGAVYSYGNSKISFIGNSTVTFTGNTASFGGAVYSCGNSKITFIGNSTVTFTGNTATYNGGAVSSGGKSTITFAANSATGASGAVYFYQGSDISIEVNSNVAFTNNRAMVHGGAIHSVNSDISFDVDSKVTFIKNRATFGGGAVSSTFYSAVSFQANSTLIFHDNNATRWGGAIYSYGNSDITLKGSSTVTFSGNNAACTGGAIYSNARSIISFKDNSTVAFTSNGAGSLFYPHRYITGDTWCGGAVFSKHSNLFFEDNSTVTFTDNIALNGGGAISFGISYISFKDNSTIIFVKNSAAIALIGGAMYCIVGCNILFANNSTVIFTENSSGGGGGIFSYRSNIMFKDKSIVIFTKNSASHGGALWCTDSKISFEDNSKVTFTENSASKSNGGAISASNSIFLFEDNSIVNFIKNSAHNKGGAIKLYSYPDENGFKAFISFKDNSTITFTENSANEDGGALDSINCNILVAETSTVIFNKNAAIGDGGAILCDSCSILFLDNSTTNFSNNDATRDGGAIHATHNAVSTFLKHASVRFDNNRASRDGGAISYAYNSTVLDKDYSSVSFSGNIALRNGGGVYLYFNSSVLCSGYSTLMFTKGIALSGGALYASNSSVVYQENVTVKFVDNLSKRQGGAVYTNRNYNFTHEGNSTVTYVSNNALFGGAIYSDEGCNLVVRGISTLSFIENVAAFGGAIYSGSLVNSETVFNGIINSTDTNLLFKGNSIVTFKGNVATSFGGAIFTLQSNMRIGENVIVKFQNNTAKSNGGALYLSDHTTTVLSNNSNVTFSFNTAGGYGGAAFIRIVKSKIIFSANFHTQFHNNSALVSGDSLYITVPKYCNRTCFNNSITGINNLLLSKQFGERIAVTPHKLELYHPAICIDNATKKVCNTYYVGSTMLGQELSVDACPVDYYGQQSNGVQFTVSGEDDDDYYIDGETDMLISCGEDTFQGVSILGNETLLGHSSNFSITLQLNVGPYSDERIFSIEVIVEISPCYPGFFHDKELQKCMCYNNTDIVFCSGSSSTIKRGYWYGSVNRQPTVAVCPVNNCDFTCCETTDGFYHLSPARENQCRAHRSGTACGDCEEGWTLSFDSAECVPVGNCTAGQTALIVVLSIIYWVGVVVAAFFMMYFKIPIGYLYAISYYYSLLDVWLNQTLYLSQSLMITFNIFSSIVKVTPQFLGQLCLVPGMNEIDQQFIHYVHPLAISLILIAISLLARASYKFSSFISRGIIHVVCLLLLLSYTSIASTSLLLMRALTFVGIDKVYTYLSPDVEYFHDRHLPYAIVAMLFTIVIVIGLPLLLLLQPFLNQCINFTRVKPLLDQFQGCYKDKFRCFAAYYMICRLIIITIVIAGSSTTSFAAYYILIGTCVIMATLHFITRPYHQKLLNVFDGVILMLILVLASLPLIDTLNSDLAVVKTFALMVLPFLMFLTMILILYRGKLEQAINHCTGKSKDESTEIHMSAVRNNSADNNRSDDIFDIVQYRECVLEAMEDNVNK